MRVTLRYVHEYRDRHGKIRRYARPPGRKEVPLPGDPGSPEFMAAYHAALANPKPPIGVNRNSPDSVAAWISLYLASAAFAALRPDTRRTRKNLLERFRAEHGGKPGALLTAGHIEAIIGKYSPVVARNFLKALRPWMKWCARQSLRPDNPTLLVERPAYKSEGYNVWPEHYVEQYRARHPIGAKARLAFEIAINTGAARVDLVTLGRQHVRDGTLSYRRHKTDVMVEIPVLDDLRAILAETDATERLTFVLTQHGKPYSKEGLGNAFRQWCNEAGVPNGYSLHGLRVYAAVFRAESGATESELQSWFGWRTMKEAAHYTRNVNRRGLAVSLGRKVSARLANRESGIG